MGGSGPSEGGNLAYAEQIALDNHARRHASTVPGKRKMPWQMTEKEWNDLPIVYRGEGPNQRTSGHVFVSNDKNVAATFGKVKDFRILPGAKIYPDPEIEGEAGKALSGFASLERGSAVVSYDDMMPNLPYNVWRHE